MQRKINLTIILPIFFLIINTTSVSAFSYQDFFSKILSSPLLSNSFLQKIYDFGSKQNSTGYSFGRNELSTRLGELQNTTQTNTTQPIVNNSPVDLNKDQIKSIQGQLGLKEDGIIGKNSTEAIKNFQGSEGLEKTGTLDSQTLKKLDEQADAKQDKEMSDNPFVYKDDSSTQKSQGGNELDMMRGTSFCTMNNGSYDKDGVDSCGTDVGKCKDSANCNYIMGSCGDPLYYYQNGNKKDPIREKNNGVCAVALSQDRLKKEFGPKVGKSYCKKKIEVCNGPGNCKAFPILDTGLKREDTIDMTECVRKSLGITEETVNKGDNLYIKRIDESGDKTQVADAKSTKNQ